MLLIYLISFSFRFSASTSRNNIAEDYHHYRDLYHSVTKSNVSIPHIIFIVTVRQENDLGYNLTEDIAISIIRLRLVLY